MREAKVQSLGWEDAWEKGMTTHSSILAWEIPLARSLAGYSPWGSQRVEHDLVTKPPPRTYCVAQGNLLSPLESPIWDKNLTKSGYM